MLTPSFSDVPSNKQHCQAPCPFARKGSCASAAAVLNSFYKINKTGSNLSAASQDFARTKEAKPRVWVMKCGISQQMINPKSCSLNVCSKARNGLDVNDGESQTDSLGQI